MLIDSVNITIQAGKGGNGIVAWRREKHVPKGGPDGGDGGRGGSVYLVASNNLDTLSSFRYRKVFSAEDGKNGMPKKMAGHSGEDLILEVPVGTIAFDQERERVVADLVEVGQKVCIAKGGKGGLGNPHFSSPTHQKPNQSTEGKPGEKRQVLLELKLIADVALIGKPNAGKSSIINALTSAGSRVGEFAFSTRQPVLGVMDDGDKKITLVDLPGLIEGAHKGRGLGDKFLKHAERVRALIHVIDATQPDLEHAQQEIINEIKQYGSSLPQLKMLTVLNKMDLLSEDELKSIEKDFPSTLLISAEKKINIDILRKNILELVS